MVGTLVFLVWGFIPFCVMISDAAFPEKETTILGRGSKQNLGKFNFIRFVSLDGKLTTIVKNSWSKHLSLTYNEKYEYGKIF